MLAKSKVVVPLTGPGKEHETNAKFENDLYEAHTAELRSQLGNAATVARPAAAAAATTGSGSA